jgi:hypothetical protein
MPFPAITVAISIQTCFLLGHSFGIHLTQVLDTAPADLTFSLQILYAGYLTYTFVMAFTRISVGLFYARLSSLAVPSFMRQVDANTALNIIWLVSSNSAAASECYPLSFF